MSVLPDCVETNASLLPSAESDDCASYADDVTRRGALSRTVPRFASTGRSYTLRVDTRLANARRTAGVPRSVIVATVGAVSMLVPDVTRSGGPITFHVPGEMRSRHRFRALPICPEKMMESSSHAFGVDRRTSSPRRPKPARPSVSSAPVGTEGPPAIGTTHQSQGYLPPTNTRCSPSPVQSGFQASLTPVSKPFGCLPDAATTRSSDPTPPTGCAPPV